MNSTRLERFKELLSVPSKYGEESQMVNYICDLLEGLSESGMNLDYYVDQLNNIYVTKGVSEYYPCFIAHTDTVHNVTKINVIEGVSSKPHTFGKDFGSELFDILYAVDDKDTPTGIGGDDKAGIFVCLELLRSLNECKVAFFVSEEIGCVGSSNADLDFFDDVSFVCEYDAPGDHLITEICSGVRLYNKNGEFISKVKPLIEESFANPMIEQSHPFTDVMQLKLKLPISCINISCGYYNMHTNREFIVIDDVERAIESGMKISQLGYEKKFYYEEESPVYYNDFESDKYDDENTEWLSDEVVIFDESENGLMTIEEYGSGNIISLTEKELKKLYEILKLKYEGNQFRLF